MSALAWLMRTLRKNREERGTPKFKREKPLAEGLATSLKKKQPKQREM